MASGGDALPGKEGQDLRKAGTIWMMDLDEPIAMVPAELPARFGPVGAEALTELAQAMNTSPVEVGLRLDNGRRCYAAYVGLGLPAPEGVGGVLAAYGWISFQEELVGELRLRVRLLPSEAYIWDCATLPEYRQKHLYSALLGFMAAELRVAGYRRAWIGADLENTVSQRGMERAGFRHIADLVLNRVVGTRLAWVLGLPGVPEELVSEARRVFLDNRDQVWLNAALIRR